MKGSVTLLKYLYVYIQYSTTFNIVSRSEILRLTRRDLIGRLSGRFVNANSAKRGKRRILCTSPHDIHGRPARESSRVTDSERCVSARRASEENTYTLLEMRFRDNGYDRISNYLIT